MIPRPSSLTQKWWWIQRQVARNPDEHHSGVVRRRIIVARHPYSSMMTNHRGCLLFDNYSTADDGGGRLSTKSIFPRKNGNCLRSMSKRTNEYSTTPTTTKSTIHKKFSADEMFLAAVETCSSSSENLEKEWDMVTNHQNSWSQFNHGANPRDIPSMISKYSTDVYLYVRQYFMEDESKDTTTTTTTTAAPAVTTTISTDEWGTKLINTAMLLHSDIGCWTRDEWTLVEDILPWLAKKPTARAVVLQFALHQRILDEKQYHRNQDQPPPEEEHAAMPDTDAWFHTPLLRTMFINWRKVHNESTKILLQSCGLAPSDLLDRIVRVYHERYHIPISEKLMFILLDAYVAASSSVPVCTRPDLAEAVLDQSLALWKQGQNACYPQTPLYNLVMYAWIKANLGRDTVDAVSRIMQRMNENKIQFDANTYNYALQIEALRGSEKGAIAAEALLRKIYQEYSSGNESLQVTVQMFACVIQAWANSGSPKAVQRAEEIYHQMLAMRKDNDLKGSWDHLAAKAVLHAYLVAAKSDSTMCSKAEDFWRNSGAIVDHDSFATLIMMYAKCGKLDDIDRLLIEMENSSIPERDFRGIDRKKIGNHAYTAALSAYAKSRVDNKLHRAESLFRRIQQWSKATTPVYNAFLSVIASSNERVGLRAEEILLEMKALGMDDAEVRPDKISYTTVMNFWARNGHDNRTYSILRMMQDDFCAGNVKAKPDRHAYNTVLAAFSRSKEKDASKKAEKLFHEMKNSASEGDPDLEPDIYTMNTIIACLANSIDNRSEAAEKAEMILQGMVSEWKAGNRSMKPTSHSYNTVINGYARSGQADKAEKVFNDMCNDHRNGNEQALPGETTFNTLVKAWAYSRRSDGAQRAEDVVQRMYELKKAGLITASPNVVTYTTLILAYGLCPTPGGPQRAEAIVEHMDALFKAGYLNEPPNPKTYSTLRRVWTSSFEPNKRQGEAAVRRMAEERFGKNAKTTT